MKKYITIIILSISLISSLFADEGSGPYIDSPNNKYRAAALLLTRENSSKEKQKYYKFIIKDKKSWKVINFLCVNVDNELGFPIKQGTELIKWSKDSQRVTFTFADFSITLNVIKP